MKKYRTISFMLIAVFMCISISQGVFAGNVDIPETVAEKIALVNHAKAVAKVRTFKQEPYDGYLLELLAKIGSGELSEEECKNELESYGCFLLESESNPEIQMYSNPSDVSMSIPTVSYLAQNDTWIVGGGGTWNSTAGIPKPNMLFVTEGKEQNVGNRDVVGLSFSNTYGSSAGCNAIGGTSYMSDKTSKYQVYNSTWTHGDGIHGIGYELQDTWVATDVTGTTYLPSYKGYHFGCSVQFNGNFKNYHGSVYSYYGHTESKCVITSIAFNTGYSPGVTVTFSDSTTGFFSKSWQKGF
ncbi:hypothetical protein [Cuneatibacter caecimuris]|uniref:LGFP repeat-containing protein n=1 Tax=Cuneatibacter caecimuris TaxID=1796618 RepID=A0A4Q7P4A9_9FIRM|nr:hypothetical protein [Cuneatibacter caecimuris]RZS94278.1 hypothetical protein EV209_2118 [Cuneatibacter caecimuris]